MLWVLRAPLFALWPGSSKLRMDASTTVGVWMEPVGLKPECSMALKRLGRHMPPRTGIHRLQSSHGTHTQPTPTCCLGFPSSVTGIMLLWQGNFFKT